MPFGSCTRCCISGSTSAIEGLEILGTYRSVKGPILDPILWVWSKHAMQWLKYGVSCYLSWMLHEGLQL
jgi:hypothetical protein